MGDQLPLAGVKVVDLTQVGAGPYMTSLLGDLGADVVKIEPPGGEPMRSVDNYFAPKESAYYFGMNRSKRDITLDLKSPAGREVIDRMLATADVLTVSMRPRAVQALGLSYEQLAERFPRLVYCSVTAFGEDGPRVDEPGMDIVAQAISGIMAITGDPDRLPVKAGPAIADWATSFMGAFAIVSALRARDRDGVGQKVSVSLLDVAIACLPNYVTPMLVMGIPIRRSGSSHAQVVPYQVFESSDGYLVLACLSDQFWPPVCRALEREEWIDDARFHTNPERVRHRDALVPAVAAIMRERSTRTWIERFTRHGVPHAPVHELEQVFEDPQVVHNEMLLYLEHPRFGRYPVINNPIRMSRTNPRPHGYSPAPGEHNEEVFRELGYDEASIRRLVAENAG
jgi:crotonobetainyl-CoA:carnitine CoA-transferase CaiB-like acyl-CoA transferase